MPEVRSHLQPADPAAECGRHLRCGRAELITREDDREEVIRQRLKAYEEFTGPVLAWFQDHVRTIDGSAARGRVSEEIERAVMAVACNRTLSRHS